MLKISTEGSKQSILIYCWEVRLRPLYPRIRKQQRLKTRVRRLRCWCPNNSSARPAVCVLFVLYVSSSRHSGLKMGNWWNNEWVCEWLHDNPQFDLRSSYTKFLHQSWKFHQLCILSSTIQWWYPKYWNLLCHSCLSMSIIIKIINFRVKNRIFKILLLWHNNFQYFG